MTFALRQFSWASAGLGGILSVEHGHSPQGAGLTDQLTQVGSELLAFLRFTGAIIHADHDGNHIRLETSDAPFERSQNAISLVTADAGIDDDVLDAPQFPADALGEVLDVSAAAVGMLGAVGNAVARENPSEGM